MPGPTILWVLPGFAGSDLNYSSGLFLGVPTSRKLWLNLDSVADPSLLAPLALPAAPGVSINPGPIDTTFYGDFLAWLNYHKPQGWLIVPWPYDWRQPVQTLAATLANAIQGVSGISTDHRIVAHSMGGLVAVGAYRALLDAGQQALITRIVTIGTPLYGCYAAAQAWKGDSASLNLLASLGRAIPALFSPFASQGASVVSRIEAYLRLYVTWPSTYNMLPNPGAVDDPADAAGRQFVISTSGWQWGAGRPDPALLAQSTGTFWPWFLDPKTQPPTNVIAHYVGSGQRTPARAVAPLFADPGSADPTIRVRLGGLARGDAYTQQVWAYTTPGILHTLLGDGTVPVWSASYPGYQTVVVNGEHSELPTHPVILRSLFQVLEPPLTKPAPAPPTIIPTPGGQIPPPPLRYMIQGPLYGPPQTIEQDWDAQGFDSVPPNAPTPPPPPGFTRGA